MEKENTTMETRRNWKSPILLLLTATIWGTAFVAQSMGLEYVGPFTFNGVRSLLGGLVLLPVIYFTGNPKKEESVSQEATNTKAEGRKTLIMGGISCGLCLCVASTVQQIGLQYTTVGKAGFLTAMYIILVPVLGLFIGKKCNSYIGISILLAAVGLYLLSIKDGFRLERADIYMIVCALVFAIHILVIDYFAPKCDGVKLSCIQFFVCGVICTVLAFLIERPELNRIWEARLPIAYAGIMSCGVAYTLQIIGQKGMNPTVASLILSLESVISVLAGWALLHQALSARELTGCGIMFVAIILAQLPGNTEKQDVENSLGNT